MPLNTLSRRDLLKTTAALVTLPGAAFAADAPRQFAPQPGPWRTFELTTRVDVADAQGMTRVWLPVPDIETEFQKTLSQDWRSNGGEVRIVSDTARGVRMLYAEFPTSVKAPRLELVSRMQTRGRAVDWSRPVRASEDPDVLQLNLAATELIPVDGLVKATALKAIGNARSDVDKTRAIYTWLVANAHREPTVRGCGLGDVRTMLETGNLGGKCADLNAIFVGMCRSVGVPARDLYGLRVAPSAFGYRELGGNPANLKGAQHCRAEVFLKQHGWVAMDPADVLKVMRQETPEWIKDPSVPLVAPVNKALFGSWEGNWIAYNTGHDVMLPGSSGKASLPFLMYPQGENASGRFDELSPDTFKYTISSKESPPDRDGMIVGTAGHIDHGKTTLVRALTGVDTDRLPEEKERGISIELGYAFLDDPNSEARIGFIDVPGHERFVHTMLAGATGIDYALLLVAADDGVMPQTREHLAVLSLLGLARGALVITKSDRAAPERLAAVRAEVEALRAGSSLAEAPILEVSATTGAGIAALQQLLFAEAASLVLRPLDAAFRLAVDRSFSLDGVGTVVTGTVHAGRVSVGDELALSPDPQQRRVRVRSLHVNNHLAAGARAGQRCALGLVGIAKDEIARGQWLCAPDAALASERIDLRLKLWPGEPRALRSGTPVHAHVGARAVTGTVALLDADVLQPGGEALAQLVLREPIGAWRGDRVVLRDASASRTMAGGSVLDPFAPQRYRRTPARLAELRAMHDAPSSAARLQTLLDAAPLGLDLRRFAVAEGLRQDLAPVEEAALLAGDWALSAVHAAALSQQVQDRLADFHAHQPDELGPEASRLRRLVAPRLPEPLWRALLTRGREQGLLAQRGAFVHLQAHGVQLSALERRIAQKTAPLLESAGFEGAWVRDLARDTQEAEALMRATLARLAQQGDVHQVVKDLYYGLPQIAKMAAIVRELAGQNAEGQVLAAGFRDATGLGRKRVIQVLEYFDRVGLLRRVGDVHRLRGEADMFS